ncbi:bile acid:sodium symporter [Halopiger goleimassiliensis]|uniref:bile acid:sodium symporter n=1 Tax=Halopiger goleimassiliensis TaxID=1293048 RepID=UPI000677FA3F|nr:bile acid:sodium symporter [Halopiger goleimassiliensis]
MDRFRTRLRSQASLLIVVVATVAGVAVPSLAAPLEPLVPVFVGGLLFTAFYGFSVATLAVRDVSMLVVVSIVCLYLLVPVALSPVAAAVLSGELLLGALIVLSAPLAAGSSIVWTRLGGGNTVLATVIVLVSMLLAPLAMPTLLTRLAGSAVDVAVADLVVDLAVVVAGGGLLAALVPDGVVTDRQQDRFSLLALGALIYVGVGGSSLAVDGVQLAFVGVIAVAALGLSAGIAYALYARGTRSDDCVTVLFSSSMKNLSVSVMVGTVFGGGAIIASITVFHVVQQLVSSALVNRLSAVTETQSVDRVPATPPGD